MNEGNDRARLLHLKRAFGGVLTHEERQLLEAFDASQAGREFAASTAEFQTLLARIAVVKPGGPATLDLRTRFDARMRAEAQRFRRRFVPFCLAVLGLFALAGGVATVVFGSGPGSEHLPGLWILLASGAFVVCAVTWERASRILHAPDVARFLDREREQVRRGPQFSTRTLFVVLLCAALLAPEWGWPRALVLAVLGLVLLRVATLALDAFERRRRLREDAQMWAWWYRGSDTH